MSEVKRYGHIGGLIQPSPTILEIYPAMRVYVLASDYDAAQSELAALREELHNARNAASESHALIESYERGKKAAEQRNAELVQILEHAEGAIPNEGNYWILSRIDKALKPTESGASE